MSEQEPLFRNRARANSFGAVADAYDRTRPRYPAAMLDDVTMNAATAVDVGCGTGILARQLQARGLSVLGVEPDAEMAAVAVSHGVEVEVGAFESWDAAGRRFDLMTAGQSWHWVDPVRGAAKAAEVVADGGTVALAWNISTMPELLRAALDEVYAALAPPGVRPTVPHRPDAWADQGSGEDELEKTGAFETSQHRSYPWSRTYTRDEWVGQLETHSDHRLMDGAARADLLDAVGRTVDALGGSFEMRYDCYVSTLRRHPR